jgi:inhibitor of KinA sporulation pathway (predicted exonuclease)
MRYVIVDLEATCWEKDTNPTRMEIIEIGAVLLPSSDGQPVSEFARFVKPIVEPVLSDFCIQLTSIQQRDVDQAEYFYTVFPDFLAWIGDEEFTLCSWGSYDLNQFRTDCKRHSLPFPPAFEQHLNLKKEFAAWRGVKRCGMRTALAILNLPLEGQHHRAMDDARNTTAIARLLLPDIENRK